MTQSSSFMAQFTRLSAVGESDDGLVRIELDGAGDILSLVIDPRALGTGAARVGESVTQAFRAVKEAVRERLAEQDWSAVTLPDLAGAGPTLSDLRATSLRRLDELTDVAHRVADRIERG
jgi:DNA-binding protein YbaB